MKALAVVILTFFIVNTVFASVSGLAVDVRLRKKRGNHSLLNPLRLWTACHLFNKQCPHPMDIVSPSVALGYTYTTEVRAFSLNYPVPRNCPDSNGDKRLNAHSYELCPTALRPSDAANLRKGAQHSKNFCLLNLLRSKIMDFAPINGRRRAQKRKYGLKYVGNYSVQYERDDRKNERSPRKYGRSDRNNDRCDRKF